ncbi:hypothetical protein PV04_00116 [Phialophora macrospora]|uniref:Uncharacterized protein n=1 Tax=Phialophora macrospora TaxID=1851006 RepID=A0A0D2FTV4_9EURO|nr:hypothetical protein PV04_00116 [Phialophora macrospora]
MLICKMLANFLLNGNLHEVNRESVCLVQIHSIVYLSAESKSGQHQKSNRVDGIAAVSTKLVKIAFPNVIQTPSGLGTYASARRGSLQLDHTVHVHHSLGFVGPDTRQFHEGCFLPPGLLVQAAVTLKRANAHLKISRAEMVLEGSRDRIDSWLQDATAKTAAGIGIKCRNLNTKGVNYKTVQVGATRVAQQVDGFAIAIKVDPMDLVWSRQAAGGGTYMLELEPEDGHSVVLPVHDEGPYVGQRYSEDGSISIINSLPYENIYVIGYKK